MQTTLSVSLKHPDKTDLQKIRALYITAFPEDERIYFTLMKWRSHFACADFFGIYDNDEWVGFFYLLHDQDLTYVYYFAIADAFRGKGYGSAALQALKTHYPGRRILLAIDPLDPTAADYELRVRRKGFYLRNGFEQLPMILNEARNFEILAYGGTASIEEYRHLLTEWRGWPLKKFMKYDIVPITLEKQEK